MESNINTENKNNENVITEGNVNIEIYSETHKTTPKPHFYIILLKFIAEFFYDLGKSICEIIADLINGVLLFTGRFIGFVWSKTESFRIFMLGKLKYAGIFIVSPFMKMFSLFSRIKNDCKTANREQGLKGALPVFFKHFLLILFGKRGLAVTVFNYTVPVISILFLVNVISYASDIDYAVRLDVNGSFVGHIDNESVFTEAQNLFEERMNFLGSATFAEITPSFTIEKIGYSDNNLNSYMVADILLEKSGVSVEYAYGIIINDTFMGAVRDNSSILVTIDNLLEVHKTGAPDEEVEFMQTVNVSQAGLYTTESIIDPQTVIRNLTQPKEEEQYYIVVSGDSHGLIADKLNMSEAELERLNPGFSELFLLPGMTIRYSAEVPALPVSVTRTEIFDKEIPFNTEYTEDDTRYKDTSRVVTDGEVGLERITARVTLVNGVETARTETDSETLSQPVTKVIARGTKPLPIGEVSSETASHGKFIYPVPRGYRVSEWGWWDGGYPGHSGIDIGAPYGTPIFAGDSGVVVYSGWYYGYGNTVIIEHANGLRTLYAHASTLLVSKGESVTQGQSIALVGQTGQAYGNHLHFEVRQGSQRYNPRHYLDF
ncbi:MAG: peptidoglycan DD-metalloendopeptidase family protein [Oscillospiraceae bacterium]|nr:peptidoglycan DD-metalloendopeptidase family protein [Oscillospiraceae bacterium]